MSTACPDQLCGESFLPHLLITLLFRVFHLFLLRDVTPVRNPFLLILPPPAHLSVDHAVHVAVQPAGQAAATEVVQRVPGQDKEENHTGAGHHDPGQEAKDVFVSRVEGL